MHVRTQFGESLCAGWSEEPSGLVCCSPGAALRKRDRPITFLLALCFMTHSGFSLPWSREYPPLWANHASRSASQPQPSPWGPGERVADEGGRVPVEMRP
jgi:hypothetical protein